MLYSSGEDRQQRFGDNACHPERSEGSGSTDGEILRFAQDDMTPLKSAQTLSPNVWTTT